MYSNILVPIAFEQGRDTQKALKIAKSLASDGAQITALHVIEEVPSYVAQYLPEGQLEKNIEEITAMLKESIGAIEGISLMVVAGHAGHTIVDVATKSKIDCIVIASHRPGLQDYFLGSTAARVVRHAPCSVHVVR